MKVSIVMPVKDTAPYVGITIQSILNQSYTNWELIAVDDHSSDDSLSVLQSFNDSRIHVVTNPNPGLLEALRYGYSKTSGMLIQRMDSDDIMPENKLELMYQTWLEHGEGSVVIGGADYFSDDGAVQNGFVRYAEWLTQVARENTFASNIYRESVIASNCWLAHRADFDAIGAFEPDVFPEDYDLCFRFYYSQLKLVGIDSIVHHWRDRSDRISRNWDVYKDNRFFDLKVHYFFKYERDSKRPLVLWGAGRNGKDLAKLIQVHQRAFHWLTNNEKKIGKDIYGISLDSSEAIDTLDDPQIIVAVASPEDKAEIREILGEQKVWFFQ